MSTRTSHNDEGFADLFVIDEDSGRVVGIVGNPDTSMVTNAMSKKKWEMLAEVQANCHTACDQACGERGGCCSHAVVPDKSEPSGFTCIKMCWDDRGGSLEDTIPTTPAL